MNETRGPPSRFILEYQLFKSITTFVNNERTIYLGIDSDVDCNLLRFNRNVNHQSDPQINYLR